MSYEQSPQPPAAQPLSPADEKLWATLIHAGGIVLGVISPLVGYLVLKDRSGFVRDNARNALNFQILIAIAYVAGIILSIVFIGLLVVIAAGVISVVFSIMGAVAANRGEVYRYPLTVAFIK